MGHFGLRTLGLRTGVLPLLIQAGLGLRTLGLGTWDSRLYPDSGFRTSDLGLGLAGPPTWPMAPQPDFGPRPWTWAWPKRRGVSSRTVDLGLGQ